MQEEWKFISGFESHYMISNLGRVRRLQYTQVDTYGTGRTRTYAEKLVPQYISNSGYLQVDLRTRTQRKRVNVHRLVAQAFIPNPDNLPCVNHKDENKTNNCVDNLEWCTKSYNNSYGTGRKKMVETRTRNGTYKNISPETRIRISMALKGKKKSKLHCLHISQSKHRKEG